ncbi:MAG: hypothetical protein E7563_00530 [Ruminococcaceae bacterium]|nr:hypothetical protein [Oscillospiraceae bacterium]
MNNNPQDKLDSMLQNYYGREQESFEFRGTSKKRIFLSYSSAIAAVLAILICAGLLIYTCIEPKNDFAINVAAQGTDEYTNLSVKTFYKATYDLEQVDIIDQSNMLTAGIIVVEGKTISDLKVKSLNREGEFLVPYDKGHFLYLDSDGNIKPFYNTDTRIVLICSDDNLTENEKTSSVWYVPVDENGKPISNNEYISEDKEDIVEIQIYFEDGSVSTSYIHISYIDGKMHLKYER